MVKLDITIKSFEWYHIKNATSFIKKIKMLLNLQNKNKLENLNEINLPKKRKIFTVLKSPHIHKKSREQFQLITYKKKIVILNKNINVIALFFFFLKNSDFPGVLIEINLMYNSSLHT